MQSKIKQVTLLDGKQIFYPSEEELAKLHDNIKEVIVEDTLTKADYELKLAQQVVFAENIIAYDKVLWYCDKCKINHSKDHACVRI